METKNDLRRPRIWAAVSAVVSVIITLAAVWEFQRLAGPPNPLRGSDRSTRTASFSHFATTGVSVVSNGDLSTFSSKDGIVKAGPKVSFGPGRTLEIDFDARPYKYKDQSLTSESADLEVNGILVITKEWLEQEKKSQKERLTVNITGRYYYCIVTIGSPASLSSTDVISILIQ